jgi:hypothetical protein
VCASVGEAADLTARLEAAGARVSQRLFHDDVAPFELAPPALEVIAEPDGAAPALTEPAPDLTPLAESRPADRLRTLKELREQHLISDEEYEAKRQDILRDL